MSLLNFGTVAYLYVHYKVQNVCGILSEHAEGTRNRHRQYVALCTSTRGCSLPPRGIDIPHRLFDYELRRDLELGGGGDKYLLNVHIACVVLLVVAMGKSPWRLMGVFLLRNSHSNSGNMKKRHLFLSNHVSPFCVSPHTRVDSC